MHRASEDIVFADEREIFVHPPECVHHSCIRSDRNGRTAFLNIPDSRAADAGTFSYKLDRQFATQASELDFAYRHTALQNSGLIVTSVTVSLQPGEAESIKAKMDDFSQRRIAKQPLELPSAGSMFKRPPGYFAGTLIEQTGLKGYTVGGAQVSTKHAGFVVNVGGATAQDVLQLISDVQSKVFAAHGVRLEPEVLVLGEE